MKNLLGHSTIVLTSDTYGHALERRKREGARGMEAVLGGRGRGRCGLVTLRGALSPDPPNR